MSTYETTHAIGDLVYTANSVDFDREVIKAIKIEGLKESVRYGIKRKSSGYDFYFFGPSDNYIWYKPSEIFLDKEAAKAHHEVLKAKKELEDVERKKREKAERRAELEDEMKELEDELGEL